MPDFEALIRHQQLKQKPSNQRLKVVDNKLLDSQIDIEKSQTEIHKPKLINFFISGFLGSLLATIALLFLYENGLFSLNLHTLNNLLN